MIHSKKLFLSLLLTFFVVAGVPLMHFALRGAKAQENQCSFLTKISVYKREKGTDSGPFFSTVKDDPFDVVNNKGQALRLDAGGSSTYTYTTEGLVFDPKGRFAYRQGEQSGIVLTGFREDRYEIAGVFCEELEGSTGGCPSPDEIQKQGRTDMIEGLRVDCGVRLSYGWIVNPLFEEKEETGSLSIRSYLVEGEAPVENSKTCSIYELAGAVGKKVPGTNSYSKEVFFKDSEVTITGEGGFTQTIKTGSESKARFDFNAVPPGTYEITTKGLTKELGSVCNTNRTVTVTANTKTETALVYWTNPGYKCETTTTCSACKSGGNECKVKISDSYLCCPGKKKAPPLPDPTTNPTIPNDPPPAGGTPATTPAPKPPSKPSVGTGWCSTEIIGARFDRYLVGNSISISKDVRDKRVAVAACICQRESSGVPDAGPNNGCITGKSREYSIGLFQLNVWAQPLHCRYTGGDVDKIFTPKNAQVPPQPARCTISDSAQLTLCENKLTDTTETPDGDNIQNMYFETFEKSRGLSNFSPWSTKTDSECNRLIQQL